LAEVFKQERVTEECKQQMIAQDETKTKIQNFKAIGKRLFLPQDATQFLTLMTAANVSFRVISKIVV
jgi:hypothetical protein